MSENSAQISFQIISMLRALIDNTTSIISSISRDVSTEVQAKGRREIIKSIEKMSIDIKQSNESIQQELKNLNRNISSLSLSIEHLSQALTVTNSNAPADQNHPRTYTGANSLEHMNGHQTTPVHMINQAFGSPIDNSIGRNININIEQPREQPMSNPPRFSSTSSLNSSSSDMTNEEMEVLANILAQTLGHQEYRL